LPDKYKKENLYLNVGAVVETQYTQLYFGGQFIDQPIVR
jgi:hypothetical protein